MRTFNRYFVHFMGIGAMILLVAVLLLVADGGELLVPIFMIALISVDTCSTSEKLAHAVLRGMC